MTALQNVLNTPELLEHILLSADIKTLLTSAQRVCHSWHRLIAESPSLQQHLFLQPAPESATKTMNSLLAEKFPHWFQYNASGSCLSSKPLKPIDLETYDLAREDRNDHFRHEKATWRRMLPQQPPFRAFTRLIFINAMMGDMSSFSTITEHEEIRDGKPYCLITDDGLGTMSGEPEDDLVSGHLDALRMERLYDLVTGGNGSSHTWQFIWNCNVKHIPIPSDFSHFGVGDDHKRRLEESLRQNGMAMLEGNVMQCTDRGPWKFAKKFVMT